MKFDYDPDKSIKNKEKHGIDFEEVQALWNDPWLLEVRANTQDEPRFLSFGRIGDKHWTVVWTNRNGSLRIISARRFRKEEISYYESF